MPELTRYQIETWSAIQQADPDFASPFFRPEFSKLVSGVHPNVEVAVLKNGPGCVGFWPYQRDAFNVARSVGLRLCDFDGVVAKRGVEWCPVDLLKHCGLTAWPFGHLVGSQAPLQRFHWSQSNAPVIDLKSGFQDYCRQKWKAGSRSIDKTLRKLRKLGREVGPVRFVANSADRRVFDTVIQWSRHQCRRTRSVDYLGLPWTRELLSRIAGFRSDDFSGMLSAVYAGDQLVAAHLGMRSRRVLHGWFPVYNREFERHSPGMVFWVLLAETRGGSRNPADRSGRGTRTLQAELKDRGDRPGQWRRRPAQGGRGDPEGLVADRAADSPFSVGTASALPRPFRPRGPNPPHEIPQCLCEVNRTNLWTQTVGRHSPKAD